jgi:ubiquinone/menaquinone biosynthesis C-methylase UbiE
MEFFDLMSISHRYMEILNPSTSEKISKLGKLLKLKKGNRVIDFGCGCAEPLTLWAEEFGITGIGIDISKDFCDRAKKKLAMRELSDQIEIVCSPAADYVFEEGAFDAATCIGATFVFGGFQQTVQAMKRAVHQNGSLGIGETHWLSNQVHPGYAQKQATTHTEPELTQFTRDEGFELEYIIRASHVGLKKIPPTLTMNRYSSIFVLTRMIIYSSNANIWVGLCTASLPSNLIRQVVTYENNIY